MPTSNVFDCLVNRSFAGCKPPSARILSPRNNRGVRVFNRLKKPAVFPVLLAFAVDCGATGSATADHGPSFSCDGVTPGSIEEMICTDAGLAALDRRLADVYAAAQKKATNEHPPVLKAEQRGWIKGRNECWKADDKRGCVEREYTRRIAQLQALYRLVPGRGPITYACNGDPRNQVTVMFFPTDPPTLYAERGDSVSLMFLAPSGSGAKHQGRNTAFWEHQGEAKITWGYGAPEMRCKKLP